MLAFCPEIYDGETIYSWLARWALRSGMPSSQVALKHLIGYGHEQLMSLLPSYVQPLAVASKHPVYELLHKHTAIDYFRPFSEPHVFENVVNSMGKGNTHSAFSQLSITASRVTDPTEIRFCPVCAAHDYATYGVTFWHVEHQLPGVIACAQHHVMLCGVIKSRSRLLLPPHVELTSYPPSAPSVAVRLSLLSSELLLSGIKAPCNERLVFAYRVLLADKGFASHNLSVRQAALRADLERFWYPVMGDSSVNSIFQLGSQQQFPTCMVRGYATQRHPLKHLLLIGALFETVHEFLAYCHHADVIYDNLIKRHQKAPKMSQQLTRSTYQQKAVALLRQHYSLRRIVQVLGGNVTTIKLIALKHGIHINRRAHKLFATERRDIWRKLVVGLSVQDIAKNIGCSLAAIQQELRSYPELPELRRKIRFYQKRAEHRAALIKTMNSMVAPTRCQIQSAARASYTWLYKHDKDWLYAHLPLPVNNTNY